MNQRTTPPAVTFPGITRPSSDFQAVRDGRRSILLAKVIDLSVARSIAAGTAEFIQFAGNSFFVDQNTDVGSAVVHFQDVALQASNVGVYVQPGFISEVPFTQLLIENTAQAGKVLRIFYGVDLDFKPSLSAALTVSGTVNTVDQGYLAATHFVDNTAIGAGGNVQVFNAAANLNGCTLWEAGISSNGNAAANVENLQHAAAAPGTLIAGSGLLSCFAANGAYWTSITPRPRRFANGRGLWFYSQVAEGALAYRFANYTL